MKDLRPAEKDFNKVATLSSLCERREGNTATKEMEDFYEWLRGFVDAEGYFSITSNRNAYTFTFGIGLHIDDLDVLKYIQNTLQVGTVFMKPKVAELVVRRLDELKVIIEIFDKTPLNSSKHLNFLSFKQAFEIYTLNAVSLEDKSQSRLQIEEIKNTMNNSRTDFSQPNRKFHMTPNWLLGFIEGDGCFNIYSTKTKNSNISFAFRLLICQSGVDLALLLAVKNYINSLAVSSSNTFHQTVSIDIPDKEGLQRDYVGLYSSTNKSIVKLNEKYNLTVGNKDFIIEILLPFFDSLTFHTKKELDYKDWKNILLLREKGFHYTPEGLELIQSTLKQMNRNRLSTHEKSTLLDRNILLSKTNELLSRPSNFESRDGKIYIKSTGGYYYNNAKPLSIFMLDEKDSVVKTWLSLTSCAEGLGLSKSGIQKRLKNQTRFDFKGKIVYLIKNDEFSAKQSTP